MQANQAVRNMPLRARWKLWVSNSYRSFMYIPGKILGFSFALVILLVILLAAVAGGVAAIGGAIFGVILPGIPLSKTALFFFRFTAAIIALPLFISLLIVNIVAAILLNLTVGLIGVVSGILTSFLVFFMEPHNRWVDHDARIALQLENLRPNSADTEARRALRPAAAEAKPDSPNYSQGLSSAYQFFQQVNNQESKSRSDGMRTELSKHLEFADFNPNVTKCAITNELLFVEEGLPDRQVVKASNGKYYFRDKLETAHRNREYSNVVFDESSVLPRPLLTPFREQLCSITLQKLTEREAVRTVYGEYFNEMELRTWLDNHSTCPLTRRPLTLYHVSRVKELIRPPEQPSAALNR